MAVAVDFSKIDGASHLPTLRRFLATTRGPVLELGMGPHSTQMLHDLCAITQRDLFSYENDKKYVVEYAKLRTPWHRIAHVATYADVPYACHFWDVVLVDQAPAHERIQSVYALKYTARFVVCHDSEDALYGYDAIRSLFTYRATFGTTLPLTTVFSNYEDVAAPYTEYTPLTLQTSTVGQIITEL